jgi:hypothetical protein
MDKTNKEDTYGFNFPVENFTQFFFSLDDETLTQIAYSYPEALRNMCLALTLDQQMLREEMNKKKRKKKLDS